MNKKYLVTYCIIIVIILLSFLFWKSSKTTNQNTPTKSSATHRAPLPKEANITLDKNGFSPNTVTIQVGSAVRWKNESGEKQTVNSDNYPTNQLYRELNFGVFSNGSSVTHTFTTPGTYGYHNQFHPKQTGKITVVE